MNNPLGIAFATATAVAVVVAGCTSAATEAGGGPTSTPTTAPSPTPSPTAALTPSPNLLDTSTWTTYVSERYGFSIAHPADWTEDPAVGDWTFENDIEAWDSTATESFYTAGAADGLGVRVSAWSVTVGLGTTVEAWIEAYCTGQNAGPCAGFVEGDVDVKTGDQHPGLLSQRGDTMAFFLDGQTIYVVAVWREETDPSVQPYGGARRLLEAFTSTLTFPAEPPQGSPGAS